MEVVILKRRCHESKFDRRQLKKVKGVPRDQLNALVDKVEITGNFQKEIKVNLCLMKCAGVFCLFIAVLCVIAATKSQDNALLDQKSHEQLEEDTGSSYLLNSSNHFVDQVLRQRLEDENKEMDKAVLEYNKTSVEDDEKTVQILLKAFNSIDRKTTLPKFLIVLIIWMVFFPLYMFNKFRVDKRVAYKNITCLLNIENELYFCKRGYLWVIDHMLNRLKLIRTHDPKQFEMTEVQPPVAEQLEHQEEIEVIEKEKVSIRDQDIHLKEKKMSETKSEEQEKPIYQIGQFPSNFMMPQMFPPFNYYPMGVHDPRSYPPQIPMYPQMVPYLHQMPFHQQPHLHPGIFGQGLQPDDVGKGQNFDYKQGENNHQKETTETGDESEGEEEESDSDVSESKHRSFGKKRKMNPDSGSVAAKFQTAKYRG